MIIRLGFFCCCSCRNKFKWKEIQEQQQQKTTSKKNRWTNVYIVPAVQCMDWKNRNWKKIKAKKTKQQILLNPSIGKMMCNVGYCTNDDDDDDDNNNNDGQ